MWGITQATQIYNRCTAQCTCVIADEVEKTWSALILSNSVMTEQCLQPYMFGRIFLLFVVMCFIQKRRSGSLEGCIINHLSQALAQIRAPDPLTDQEILFWIVSKAVNFKQTKTHPPSSFFIFAQHSSTPSTSTKLLCRLVVSGEVKTSKVSLLFEEAWEDKRRDLFFSCPLLSFKIEQTSPHH